LARRKGCSRGPKQTEKRGRRWKWDEAVVSIQVFFVTILTRLGKDCSRKKKNAFKTLFFAVPAYFPIRLTSFPKLGSGTSLADK
jgi:hypothetical protein